MRKNTIFDILLCMGAVLLLCSCGSGTRSNAVNGAGGDGPTISSVLPSAVQQGGPAFTLVVYGSGFVSSSNVRWNGSSRTTAFISASQLNATIEQIDRATVGADQITVSNPNGSISNSATVNIMATPPPGLGVFQMVSVATDGTPSNGNSYTPPSISSDGRYVAFQSDATNLVTGTSSGFTDIYVRDTCVGAATGCSPSTIRASVASDGSLPNGNSRSPSISSNGRYVAFDSSASNLIPSDNNGQSDVFIRDTCIGAPACTPTTSRVSLTSSGGEANNDSRNASISSDGRFVAFHSVATNLVVGDTNSALDVFVRDTCVGVGSGCTPTTFRVSVSSSGVQGNTDSFHQVISGNGRYVAFKSYATNLVASDTNNQPDVFLRDTCFGATSCSPSTVLLSIATDGTQANDHLDLYPSISASGRYTAFTSFATNLVPIDTNGVADVFVRDVCIGATGCSPSTFRASLAFDGSQGNSGSTDPAISGDGRLIAFDSLATNLVPGGTSAPKSVFSRDTCAGVTGCSPNTFLVSVAADGSQGNGQSFDPATNFNGQYVVFLSNATNLTTGSSNGNVQVWISKIF